MLQLLLKFFFGVRALRFGEFVFDFGVAGDKIHLVGALEENFAVDQLVENVELERKSLFLRGGGRLGS